MGWCAAPCRQAGTVVAMLPLWSLGHEAGRGPGAPAGSGTAAPRVCSPFSKCGKSPTRASQKAGLGVLLEHGTGTIENVLIPFFPLLSTVTDWFQRLCKAGLFCLGTSQSTAPSTGERSRSGRAPFLSVRLLLRFGWTVHCHRLLPLMTMLEKHYVLIFKYL